MSESIWIKRSQEFLSDSSNSGDDFSVKLDNILEKYIDEIKKKNMDKKIEEDLKLIKNKILDIVKTYLHGNIRSAYTAFYNFWFGRKNNSSTNQMYVEGFAKKYSFEYSLSENILYRMRIVDKDSGFRKLESKELFHMPIHLRGKVKNFRYSINAYPCLYCGKSIYTCWMEMRRPHIEDFYITALRAKEPLKLLDLRIDRKIQLENDELKYLMLYPLIIACSIRVPTEHDNDTFKPEYIIPQILMHSLLASKQPEFDGIIYTSTQRDNSFDFSNNDELNDNVVLLPKYQDGIFGANLKNKLEMTNPTSYDMEIIKRGFNLPTDDKMNSYERSFFGRLEKSLREGNFESLN